MHLMSPAVERAIVAAQSWASSQGSPELLLSHHILGLLDEEEGRPAVLLERLGLDVPQMREQMCQLHGSPAAPSVEVLFQLARSWSIRCRHDPQFLSDAFLLAVVSSDRGFAECCSKLGLSPQAIESQLIGVPAPEPAGVSTQPVAEFHIPGNSDRHDAFRIVDANLNRSREALRVLEDHCRFTLHDELLTTQLKQFRHEVATIAARLPTRSLLTARETLEDVGIHVTAAGEYTRSNLQHVALVNCKRLQESLRSLEEVCKVLEPELGQACEALRYRSYTLEKAMLSHSDRNERLAAARLYLLVSGTDCPASLEWTVQEAMAGGVDIIQLREKNITDREWISRAQQVRKWTRNSNVLFIVNDRPDIALLVEADGVHLGQDDLPLHEARRILGPDVVIGISTHSMDQVEQAILSGANYLGVGPVFTSRTKEFDHFPGLAFVQQASAATTQPAFALGGINSGNVHLVIAAGAKRVAVSAAISHDPDPRTAAQNLREALD